MNEINPRCRRCHRALRSPVAVAAGIGTRCALLAALEAAQGAGRDPYGQRLAETAVALITAQLGELPRPVVDSVLRGAPADDVARVLAAVLAWLVERAPDGDEWLRKVALSVAVGGADG